METAISRSRLSLDALTLYQAFNRTGNERIRVPVAAKMALVRAGITGGSAGSPRPVGGLSGLTQAISISGVIGMRASGKSLKLLCCTTPSTNSMACPVSACASPSITAPRTWFSAPLGDLGEIAAMREVEGKALGPASLPGLTHPVRGLHHPLDHVARASGVEGHAATR